MAELPTVCVAQGVLQGRHVATEGGKGYFSFQGVPYARPPVGSLRFQLAQPAESWEGIRDALKEGNSCPQIQWYLGESYKGDEDCLYMNIYSPELPTKHEAKKYPVMVWIHGGGLITGSGDTDMYGPEFLVEEDVVLVTFNYRLGIFGFLSFEDGSMPDNLGFKDQVAALRWVKENVAVFGGDPNNITIFGESAGAASVHYQVLSPMSKGLFHKAIIQSGCAVSPWSVANKPREVAFRVGRELGNDTSNAEEMLEFLKGVPARKLTEISHIIDVEQWCGDSDQHFGPIVEKHAYQGQEVFLPEDPRKMMKEGQFHLVPTIIGMTSQEGLFMLHLCDIMNDTKQLSVIGKNLEKLIPWDVGSKLSSGEILERMKNFYFGNRTPSETTLAEFVDLYGDIVFTRGIDNTARTMAGRTTVFYYHFAFSGKFNFFKNYMQAGHLPGACHIDELGYLFGNTLIKPPDLVPELRDRLTLKRMVQLWTDFAKTGNPTPDIDPVIGLQWPRFTLDNPVYLNIDDSITVETNLYKKRIDFWNSL